MFKTLWTRRQLLLAAPALLSVKPAFASTPSTGIIFAGASWCPVCKRAAPILAAFSERHGLPVIVASADERPIPPFPNLVPLSGHALEKTVSVYPTTFIYSAPRDTVIGRIEGYRNPTWYLKSITAFIRQSEGTLQ